MPASSSTTIIYGQKKRPKQCVHYASSTGCLRGKDCLYLHQNDPVTKKPLPADPVDVQRLSGKPQIVLKASAVPTDLRRQCSPQQHQLVHRLQYQNQLLV